MQPHDFAKSPTILPPYVVADFYRRRWRIEEAFYTVKRLLGAIGEEKKGEGSFELSVGTKCGFVWLKPSPFFQAAVPSGLSYLWTGSINGVKLQVWATWLFYAVLVDLGDAIADELALPFDRIYARDGVPRFVSLHCRL